MRVLLEMTEQQQIINVWSCTSAICKFIFSKSNDICYFLVSGVIRLTEIFFARPLNSQNNKLSYQKVDMFEFDIILCFIVLLIPLLPTPIFFIPFFLDTFLVKTCKKMEKKTLANSTKILENKKKPNWNFVLGQGSIPNMVTGIRVSGWILGPLWTVPGHPRSTQIKKGSKGFPHHSSLKGFKRFQGKI